MIDRERFAREGFVAGIPALTEMELAVYRPKLLALYEALPEALHKHFINLHGVLDWAAPLCAPVHVKESTPSLPLICCVKTSSPSSS